jgi:DNA-binding GntR family transcriptional regulator
MFKLYLPEKTKLVTKKDYVVDTIRNAILVGHLLPGARITEQEIKDLLKVSSSPIREAFHQLEAEGLLTKNPHVGTKVTEMDIGDSKELYRIQSLLQGTAVQICTKKLSDEDIREGESLNDEMKRMIRRGIDVKGLRVVNYKLHMLLCGVSVHPWLTRLISALWIRFPTQSYWLMPDKARFSVRQHEKIIAAVLKRDEILAGTLMKNHLESSMKALYGYKRK